MELSALAGNPRLRQSLLHRKEDLPQTCLISGPKGSGRHTLAAILSQAMVCQAPGERRPCGSCPQCKKVREGIHPDVTILSGPGEGKPISVDQIRALRTDAYIRPNEGRRKIYLLEQAGEMNPSAQNAMLKLLEEGPSYAAFLLLCENPGSVLQTIRSRCEHFPLTPVSPAECELWLRERFPHKSREEIAAAAQGCQGILGRAVEELSGDAQTTKQRREQVQKLASILESADELTVLEALLPLEKLGKEEFPALLAALEAELVGRIPKAKQPKRVLRCVELVKQLRQAHALNVGAGHLLGWLSAGILDNE